MAKVLPVHMGTSSAPHVEGDLDTKSKNLKRWPVTTILEWVRCYSVYVSVVCEKDPTCIADLMGYLDLIVEACVDTAEKAGRATTTASTSELKLPHLPSANRSTQVRQKLPGVNIAFYWLTSLRTVIGPSLYQPTNRPQDTLTHPTAMEGPIQAHSGVYGLELLPGLLIRACLQICLLWGPTQSPAMLAEAPTAAKPSPCASPPPTDPLSWQPEGTLLAIHSNHGHKKAITAQDPATPLLSQGRPSTVKGHHVHHQRM